MKPVSINEGDTNFPMEEFNPMIETAKSELAKTEAIDYTQSVVVKTQTGALYHAVIRNAATDECTQEREFLDKLKEKGDTEIQKIVCMWRDFCFDAPSFAFRKILCEMNENNKNAEMLLQGKNCYIKKKMAVFTPSAR